MKENYVLKLSDNKYYIGTSENYKKRIESHFNNEGSQWTKLHKPLELNYHKKGDEADEEILTLKLMAEYGIDNVRGGSYTNIVNTDTEKKIIERQIKSINNLCYKCGVKGHYINDCNSNKLIDKLTIPHYHSNIIVSKDGRKDGGNLTLKEYDNFYKKCKGDCEQCNNTRIEYKYSDEDDEYIYVSCVHCYYGAVWGNDMFVVITK